MIPAAADGTVRIGGLAVHDHTLDVPLDHDRPDGERIRLFAREVVAAGKDPSRLPWLLYLQGGPGGEADRPDAAGGWIGRAVQDFRVLLLDQRGTGRSTPVTPARLESRGDVTAQADYLALHRADAIVRDAELLRARLLGDAGRWSLLGQSYGGFCAFTYLTRHPESLDAVHVTGGVPSLDADADAVYRAAYPRVRAKNAAFATAYPDDASRLQRLAELVRAGGVVLPDGSTLTVRRLQTLGMGLGSRRRSTALHWLLDHVLDGEAPSPALLGMLTSATSHAAAPLYLVLHESIYAQGPATRWAAARVRAENPDFADDAEPLLLTGEMVYPEVFDDEPGLRPYAEVAHALAERDGWGPLYDADVLAGNRVPVAAAVYADDMYVDAAMSLQTTERVPGVRTWLTDEFEHDGLRESPGVLDRLLRMTRGQA